LDDPAVLASDSSPVFGPWFGARRNDPWQLAEARVWLIPAHSPFSNQLQVGCWQGWPLPLMARGPA